MVANMKVDKVADMVAGCVVALAMFYRKNLHVRIVDKGIEEVGCLSKQCVGLPWDRGHLK